MNRTEPNRTEPNRTCPRPTSLVHTALALYSGGHHLSLLEVVTATILQVGVDILDTLLTSPPTGGRIVTNCIEQYKYHFTPLSLADSLPGHETTVPSVGGGTLCCFDVKQKLRRVKRDFKFGRDIARGEHHELHSCNVRRYIVRTNKKSTTLVFFLNNF
jgi:hypothetical protein